MSEKLTKRLIDACKYEGNGKSRDVRWDDTLPGFGVRIYPTERKAFVLFYRQQGHQHLMTLGAYGALTLEQARIKAKRCLANIVDGSDPMVERRQVVSGESFGDLCRDYLDKHAIKKSMASTKEDQRRINNTLLPRWERRKVKAISRADVSALHHEIGTRTPYEANRILSLLHKMFELAEEWGYLDHSVGNPAHGIQRFKETRRDRWATEEEVRRLFTVIEQEENIYIRAAVLLYLLTGARKTELLAARWEDVDLIRNEWRIPLTKAGRIHHIPLSTPACDLLSSLPKEDGNPFVLPGKKKGAHIVNINSAWERIRKEAALDDLRLHDLRRTVGSWLAQTGNSLPLIGKVLNHSNPSTTQIYTHFSQNPARIALEEHGKRVMEAITPYPNTESKT